MKNLRCRLISIFVVITLALSVFPLLGSDTAEAAAPKARLSIDSYDKSIILGETVKIRIEGKNRGSASAIEGDLQLSFKNMEKASALSINTDLKYIERSKGDSLKYWKYGQKTSKSASYALVCGYEGSWGVNEKHYLKVTVKPKQTGTFKIYAKFILFYDNYNKFVYDPTSGTVDQQYEYVRVLSVKVTKEPVPKLTYDSPLSSITIGDSIDIKIYAKNTGGTADEGDVQLSFNNIEKASDLTISSDMNYITKDKAESLGYWKYGKKTTTSASYAFVCAYEGTWKNDERHELKVTVKPKQAGTFEIYAKFILFYEDYNKCVYTPSSGQVDQQKEYVKVFSVIVKDKPKAELTFDDVPTSIVLDQSVDITIYGKNTGGSSDEGILQLAFPGIEKTSDLKISSDIDYKTKDKGSSLEYWNYGEKTTSTASYALVCAYTESWSSGTEHYLEVSVKPHVSGEVNIYAKFILFFNDYDECIYEPSSGQIDQQNEYVKVFSINVKDKPRAELTYDDVPISIALDQSIDIKIYGKNIGGPSDEGILQLAFPEIEKASDLTISSDIDYITKDQGNSLEYWNYGEKTTTTASYALVCAYSEAWNADTEHYLEVSVKPSVPGGFKIQSKFILFYDDYDSCTYEPSSGSIDQQKEFVHEFIITVEPAPSSGLNELAILVVGTIFGDTILDRFIGDMDYLYGSLIHRGYSDDMIYYMSPEDSDVNDDGIYDTDSKSTKKILKNAITKWAKNLADEETHLLIYLRDHGGNDGFCINEYETLRPAQLASWINNLKESTGIYKITLVVSSCHAGVFFENLASKGTVIIAKSPAWSSAYGGFDKAFGMSIKNGDSVYSSFLYAIEIYYDHWSSQLDGGYIGFPQIDDDGNGIPNQDSDGKLANIRYIGIDTESGPLAAPTITLPYEHKTVPVDSFERIRISIESNIPVTVHGELIPPNFNSESEDYQLTQIYFNKIEDSTYEGLFFVDVLGEYRVLIYATDTFGNYYAPEICTINSSLDSDFDGIVNQIDSDDDNDIYEDDIELFYHTDPLNPESHPVPPKINHIPPNINDFTVIFDFICNITDQDGDLDISSVCLYYSLDSGQNWMETQLYPVSKSDEYSIDISLSKNIKEIWYYFTARDYFVHTAYAPENAPETYYQIYIPPPPINYKSADNRTVEQKQPTLNNVSSSIDDPIQPISDPSPISETILDPFEDENELLNGSKNENNTMDSNDNSISYINDIFNAADELSKNICLLWILLGILVMYISYNAGKASKKNKS
jgi:hypothetical protein